MFTNASYPLRTESLLLPRPFSVLRYNHQAHIVDPKISLRGCALLNCLWVSGIVVKSFWEGICQWMKSFMICVLVPRHSKKFFWSTKSCWDGEHLENFSKQPCCYLLFLSKGCQILLEGGKQKHSCTHWGKTISKSKENTCLLYKESWKTQLVSESERSWNKKINWYITDCSQYILSSCREAHT